MKVARSPAIQLTLSAEVGKIYLPFLRQQLRRALRLLQSADGLSDIKVDVTTRANRSSKAVTRSKNATLDGSFVKQLSILHRRAQSLQDVAIQLVGDPKMSDLHVQFMDIEGPTDVLTFPLDENDQGHVTSGEIAICVPEARRRATMENVDTRHEILLYAVHGILHLMGMDDRTKREFSMMHRTEDLLLTRLGIGNVFDRSRRHASQPASHQPAIETGRKKKSVPRPLLARRG